MLFERLSTIGVASGVLVLGPLPLAVALRVALAIATTLAAAAFATTLGAAAAIASALAATTTATRAAAITTATASESNGRRESDESYNRQCCNELVHGDAPLRVIDVAVLRRRRCTVIRRMTI